MFWAIVGLSETGRADSADVRQRAKNRGHDGVFASRWVGPAFCRVVRFGRPAVEVFWDPLDDVRILDQGEDAHGGVAEGTLERIDLPRGPPFTRSVG